MKKIAALILLATSCLMSGCTDTDEAIADYCNWESYCTDRSYTECRDLYYHYTDLAPGCDDAIIEMADAYSDLTCPAYHDYALGMNDICVYWQQNGYRTPQDCEIVMNRVYAADRRLRDCLFSYGVDYYGML